MADQQCRPPARIAKALDVMMPQDLDAEKAVLGSILLDAKMLDDVALILRDGSIEFSGALHTALYDILLELAREDKLGSGADEKLIKAKMEERGTWDRAGKYIFLSDLIGAVPFALRACHYADLVHNAYLDRKLLQVSHNIVVRSQKREDTTTVDRLAAAEKEVGELTERRVTGEPVPIGAIIAEVFAEFDRKTRPGLDTGLFELDEMLVGLQPSELIIIAGRTSSGKTALCLGIAEHLALFCDQPILFISLEMSRHQIAQRLLTMRSEVPMFCMRRELGPHQRLNLESARKRLDTNRLLIDDASSLSIDMLRAKVRIAKRGSGVKIVFVDYLQLVRSDRRSERRELDVAEVVMGLKAMAKELDLPVVAAAQLSRAAEYRADKKPTLSDLRESGTIEQSADVVLLLWPQPDASADSQAGEPVVEILVAKQRNGPVGKVELNWHRKAMRFGGRIMQPSEKAPADGKMF